MPKKVGGFKAQLDNALKHIKNAGWLDKHSPLASPYFLGEYLHQLQLSTQDGKQSKVRGKALQQLLYQSLELLKARAEDTDEDSGHKERIGDRYKIIKLFFLDGLSQLEVEQESGFSHSHSYNIKNAGLDLLEEILVQQLHPALRLESPLPPPDFVGRTDLETDCLAVLRQGQSVGLSGPAGIGKTALAAHLAKQMTPQPIFWYTFHIGINDRLNSLLFSLAYFLQQNGIPQTWLQLVADEGQVDMKVVPSQLRHALQELQKAENTSPILCFDEVDLLNSAIEEHALIIDFLNSLSAEITLLLVGQDTRITASIYHELPALPSSAIQEMLLAKDIRLYSGDLTRLEEFTRGNPRLLALFIVLHEAGEPLPNVLAEMVKAPSLEVLLNRVLRKLDDREQLLLFELSVYRLPAPLVRWSGNQDRSSLNRLSGLQLVQRHDDKGPDDDQGAVVSLLPAYRELIYASLSPEQRELLHLAAANTYANLAEYTASADHLVQAHQHESAIRLWYPHMDAEINQGQAERALMIFEAVSSAQLSPKDQKPLRSVRSRLNVLRGNYGGAREELKAILSNKDLFSIRGYRMQGDIAEAKDELDAARVAYLEGLGTVNILLEREAIRFVLDVAWIDRRKKNFSNAWRGTELAEYELEHLRGEIMRDQGNLVGAEEHYQKALTMAKRFSNVDGEAKTSNSLGNISAQQSQFEVANGYWETAYQLFKRIGRLSAMASPRINQAIGFFLAKKFEEAIPLAEEALSVFDAFMEPRGQASAANTLAEAHFALGNLEKAEQYIGRVLETEVESIIADTLRLYAELELQRKNYSAAKQHSDRAIEMAHHNSNPYIEGYAYRVLGKVYLEQGDCAQARRALDAAIDIFTTMKLPPEAEQTQKIWDDSACADDK